MAAKADSIAASPIVIEGYFEGPNSAEQIARSAAVRLRCEATCRTTFNWTPRSSACAMKSTPPSGFDHATWDGVCVVIVTPKP